MSIIFTQHEGRILLNLIGLLGETEWQKCINSKYKILEHGVYVEKNQSQSPPFVCFRFKKENSEIIQRLKLSVENYQGKISWIMRGRMREGLPGINWCIEPKRVEEVKNLADGIGLSPDEYIEKLEPNFGPVAYEDLIGLTEHIRSAFSDILSDIDISENT